jgi:hypothetical protein
MVKIDFLEGRFSVCKLPLETPIPEKPVGARLWTLTITSDEISVICPEGFEPQGGLSETGWRALKVVGTLDFDQIGILSGISRVLAGAEISIFALSTYDTDYILVKESRLSAAAQALQSGGYDVGSAGHISGGSG